MTTSKGGPPTILNEELADKIFNRIATSTIGTGKLCDMYDDMPCENAIYEWRLKYPWFGEKYAQAKMKQAELMAEKLVEMCYVPTYEDEKGVERVDAGRVAAQRLLVDTVKWQASKLAPKVYGDKSHPESASTDNLKDVSEKLDKLMAAKQKEY